MSKDPAVLFYINDWLTSTAEMDADCRGWYLNLLLHNYDKKSLPNDLEKLAVLCNVKFSEYGRFKQVFEHVLKQKFEQIENGYYLAFDESEEFNDGLPKRLYGLDISIIKNHSPKYKETKFNPGKKELFYQIPKNLIKRYKLDTLKGKYIEYTI